MRQYGRTPLATAGLLVNVWNEQFHYSFIFLCPLIFLLKVLNVNY